MDHSKVTHLRRRAPYRRRYSARRALHARRSSAKTRLARCPSGVGVAAVRDFASRTGERSPPDAPEYVFEASVGVQHAIAYPISPRYGDRSIL